MSEPEIGRIVRENEQARLTDIGDGIGRIQFLSKGNSLSVPVRAFLAEVLERDACGFDGLVIVNEGRYYSAGADLNSILEAMDRREFGDPTSPSVFQQTLETIKGYSRPIVAAPFKSVLGGGLELCMHCHARVALRKVYMGLVEVNVGLLPTGGGLKESALAVSRAPASEKDALLLRTFEKIMLRSVSGNAQEAVAMDYLQPGDRVVETEEELLPAAKAACLALVKAAVPAAGEARVTLGGKRDYDKLMERAGRLLAEGRLTAYDLEIGRRIARVLAGSDTENDVRRTARELLVLEALGMWELKQEPGTRDRIGHFLAHGSMLRN